MSQIFYALHLPEFQTERVQFLEKACNKLGIQFKALDPYSFDFSKPSPVVEGDIVYRVSRGRLLRFFEDFVVRSGTVTFYNNVIFRKPDPFFLEKQGIPVPKTIFCVSKRRSRLLRYVQELGGYPVILKALGGTHGMGVMKIETQSSLLSMVDFLVGQGKLVILRQFIPITTSARFIVLGDKVISSLEYIATDNDFRSNAGKKLNVQVKKYPKMYEELAVKATQAMGWEFGGVDMLIHEDKPYVSEVNFPCHFVRAQKVSGQDIALEMVKYLKEKSERVYKLQ